MGATYAISVKALGSNFETVRATTSELASSNGCMFWWKPQPPDCHDFIFTNHEIAIRFITFLRNDLIGDDVERLKYIFVSPEEVTLFANHCVYIRSVYAYARRLFSESSKAERESMEATAPLFFEDLAQVFTEIVVLAACRITDPWKERSGRENFAVELFASALARDAPLHQELAQLQTGMEKHRSRIEKARHKLTAHADRDTDQIRRTAGCRNLGRVGSVLEGSRRIRLAHP